MQILFKIFLFIIGFIGIERLCHQATDGFAMVNIYPPVDDNSKWKRSESLDPSLINQTYFYHDCGSQSYIFLSNDHQTVLKLFKFQHMRIPPWLNAFRSCYLQNKKKKKRIILEKTFNSFSIAYDYFKEESGLLFLHLAKTNYLKTKITVIDKIGKRHTVELDKVPFLLQKKGELAYDMIDLWMNQDQVEKAKLGIKNLLTLSFNRCKKGIFDKDPDFSTNFGFIDEKPFQIDFGRFNLDPNEKDPKIYGPEMIRITRNFHLWIKNNHPNLVNYFQEELTSLIE